MASTMDARTAEVGYRRGARRALIALALLGLTVAVASPAGARAAAWLPFTDVSAPQAGGASTCGFFSGQPGIGGVDVATNARGDAIVGWTQPDGTDPTKQVVETAFRPAGGSFGSVQSVGTTLSCYTLGLLGPLADVAIDAQGNAVVVFPATHTHTVIDAATRPFDGTFGTPVELTDNSADAGADPRVAMGASGSAVAVWSHSNGVNTLIQQSTKPPGGSFGPPNTLSDVGQNATSPRVAVNDRGDASVAWLRNDGTANCSGGCLLTQATVRPAGSASFASTQTLSTTGKSADQPDVAIDPQGRATIVWTRPANVGTDTVVESRFLTAAGSLGSGVDSVSDPGTSGNFPRVAVDANNTAIAVWSGCPSGTSTSCVTQAARRPSNGSFGAVQSISAPGNGTILPTVAIDPSGNAVALWTQSEPPSSFAMQAAVEPAGGVFGGVQDISQLPGEALVPSLSIDGEGNAVAIWLLMRPPPDGREVAQLAVFDAGPPALASVSLPTTGTTGQPVGFSAQALDRWSPVTTSWTFGDGSSGSGSSVSHAYGGAGVFTVTVTATDAAGNRASTASAIQVSNPPPPPPPPPTPRITSAVATTWAVAGSRLTLRRMTITGLPSTAVVEVRCSGKRCPFKRKKAAKPKRGVVNALKAFGRHTGLRAGQTIEVRITAPGYIAKVVQYTLKKGKIPSGAVRCIPLGKKTPQRRC